jgi:hypothetical protein
MHFGVGDKVLLQAKNITTSRLSKKFDARYLGPFEVLKKIGKQAYRLDLPPSMARIHPVFNVALLEPWSEPFKFKNFHPGPIEIPEDEVSSGERYEVEGILEHKDTAARGREYRVKWLGWSLQDATWEPPQHLDECDEILAKYLRNPKDVSRGSSARATAQGRPIATPVTRKRT